MTSTATAAKPKEHPIIFSGPMVRAVLEGRKTQTRRVAQCMTGTDFATHHKADEWIISSTILNIAVGLPKKTVSPRTGSLVRCPYGAPGDRLWVRETFARLEDLKTKDPGTAALLSRAFYRQEHSAGLSHDDATDLRWRSPIHMPRELSRITLEVTNVRVERLQEISDADAKAEGVDQAPYSENRIWIANPANSQRYIKTFRKGWDAINAKRGYSWASNPFVWVIEFKKL